MEGCNQLYVSEEDGPRSSHQSLLHRQRIQAKRKCCSQVRRIGSKGAVLVAIWSLLVHASVINCTGEIIGHLSQTILTFYNLVWMSVVALIGPIAGLFAGIYCGRYKAVHAGLWMMWTGSAVDVLLFILQWFLPESQQILSYSGFLITAVVSSVGYALYLVNSLPFGLDQMPDASGGQISAFIHWYVWSIFLGMIIAYPVYAFALFPHFSISDINLLLSLTSVTLLSVILSSSFLLRGWLIIEPKAINPLKTIWGVLKFALKHKIPVRRSAFTYWEAGKPSRIDLAKSKYGGPFTNEEVEDVKTCMRMGLVIASITATMVTASAYILSVSEAKFIYSEDSFYLECLISLSAILSLPVYEVFFHPLIRKWIPSTLRKVGLAQTLIVIASLIQLVSLTIWYMYMSPTMCMFASEVSSPLPVDYNWVEVPIQLLVYSFLLLLLTAILEFVCAQAPYNLRGLLVGLVYAVVLSNFLLGVRTYTLWSELYRAKGPDNPSCGVWFYLFTTIATTLGCVLWCAVAKWYKKRERDEPEMCRIFAENYYDH